MGKNNKSVLRGWIVLLVVSFILPLSNGCKKDSLEQVIRDIAAVQTADLIKQNEGRSNFVILDVRTPSEYKSGYMKDAVNIDYNAADFETNVKKLDRNKTYLIYCRSGNRSAAAAADMKKLDFKDLYNLLGGIKSWIKEEYPTITPE